MEPEPVSMLGWVWMWGLWLGLSTLLLGGMLSFRVGAVIRPRPVRRRPCLWRYVRGDMTVGGTVHVGLGLGGAGWWCWALGLLASDLSRGLLVVGAGALVLTALFNAGRRRR
ncbi:hypothetical protein [Serratia marcescens]|uniref:hypothetical protein n=1 Tax=Serratia marcescens TaxID=615 RepID=UPI00217B026B|nr:hypothetical protein [Serratia marcescens]CAI1189019.1 Uncharacterised protein [Serratia marcescens]